jgi:hypothetical protein
VNPVEIRSGITGCCLIVLCGLCGLSFSPEFYLLSLRRFGDKQLPLEQAMPAFYLLACSSSLRRSNRS